MRLYLAPMRGLTTVTFRAVFAKYFNGMDVAISPFISKVGSARVTKKLFKDVLPEHNRKMPVIPQYLGNNADELISIAGLLADIGYDEVNWNLGCPWPHVVKKKRGAGMLNHIDTIVSVLEKVVVDNGIKLSIKTRLGVNDPHQLKQLLASISHIPLTEFMVHPRTAEQMYEGEVDLDAFEECLPVMPWPVVYNGDIVDLKTFHSMQQRFPQIDRWMLGRGILTDPFLGEIIKHDSTKLKNPIKRVYRFIAAYRDELQGSGYGGSALMGRLKALWFYLAEGFANGEKIGKKVRKAKTIDRYNKVVDQFFEKGAKWSE